MSKVFAIARKEIAGYFRSPIAYIILIVTISIFNVLFYVIVEQNAEATLRDIFKTMEFMFLFIIPLLTMKVFSEEKQRGTVEFLMTTPTSNAAIVWGKFIGTLSFFSFLLLLTGIYYVIVEVFSAPDRPATFLGYAGLWLEGALFIAIGIWISSLTKNQIVAAICSYLLLFFLYFSLSFTQYTGDQLGAVIRYVSTIPHQENFQVGILRVSDVVYYLSGIFLFLTLTRLAVDNRLWK